MYGDIKISSLNIRGMRDFIKRKKTINYMKDQDVDVFFLQETHSCKNTNKVWNAEFGHKCIFVNGFTNKCGVAIVIANKNI